MKKTALHKDIYRMITGTLGISKENLTVLGKLKDVQSIEGGHCVDVIAKKQGSDEEHAVKVMGETDKLNQMTIVEGKLPQAAGECLADEWYAQQNNLKTGDILNLSSGNDDDLKDTLEDTTYKITGIGRSAEYLSRSRGSTTIGTGTLSGFIVVPKSEFSSDIYTEVYLTAKGAKAERAYSETYKEKVKQLEDEIKDISKTENEKRLKSVQKEAEQKIADAKQDAKDIKKGKWYVLNREKMQSYVEYGQEADRIAALGRVVPVIFFLVAALVSLTAMTRMVEEQRTQIGMMKALGYSGVQIAMKYVAYSLAATLSGSILGAVIGEKLLPWIIINAYKMMYTGLGDVYTPLEIEYSLMAGGLAVGVVILAVLSACYKELREKPAQLMRPVAPKEGKRILLERIPFIWKRLSFIWKATMRNLFRYKKRFFMTIFGIGGCMALLLLGFGIKDSISAISEKQYGEIITYDFSITYKDGISATKKEDLIRYAKKQKQMTDLMEVSESAVTIRANGEKQDATMILPMSKKDFHGYISLQDRKSKTKYPLDDEGIILTEKAASLLGVKKGDVIKIKRSGDQQITAKVSQITENYLQHKVYMTPKLYEKLYHKKAKTTGIYCIEKNISKKKMQENGKQILAREEASALHFCADDAKTMSDMVNNLNIVVIVLIVSAGLLAFVVLYNLNNINISERRMELATIKVLGFYDGEVGAYVYRENILLTILGTIAGIILGIILHKYVIFTTEVDLIMFGRQIYLPSYVYSILLTIAFSILVNFFMYFQLKKIDMVESLKSTE